MGATTWADRLVGGNSELAFAWSEGQVEPRRTGYDIVIADANLDSFLTARTWETWQLHSLEGDLLFTGRFVCRFENGVPAAFFFGSGSEDSEGQRVRGYVDREPNADGYNTFGRIAEPRSLPR